MQPQPRPPVSNERIIAVGLREHVEALAHGPRTLSHPGSLDRAAAYIARTFRAAGYPPRELPFDAYGQRVVNIEAEYPGRRYPERIMVIGAHYDTIGISPGANDNASGVAAVLELARLHAVGGGSDITVRFVTFANEEPPHFMAQTMGSLVYARSLAARGERIVAMLSLETIGYYRDEPGTQQYPPPFDRLFPDRGNFIAMVSNLRSAWLLRRSARAFRRASPLKVIASPAPERIPGVGWSDHWSFWQQGYRAIMLTDTALYRYPHYHTAADTPDKIDYQRTAQVVLGVHGIVRETR